MNVAVIYNGQFKYCFYQYRPISQLRKYNENMDKSKIIFGPKSHVDISQNGSLGRILLDKLQSMEPKKIALVDALTQETLTYGEILKNSIRVAIFLEKMDVKFGDRVLLLSENNIYYYTYILGCIFIGAAICPMNPELTTYELNHVLNMIKPKAIFASEKGFQIASLITSNDELNNNIFQTGKPQSTEKTSNFILKEFNPETTTAMILLSSGTTGLPKGVVLSHRNIHSIFPILGDKYFMGIGDDDTTIGLVPFYHAIGVILGFANVYYGLKLVVMSKFNPAIYLKAVEDFKITKLFVVPPLAIFLAKSPLVSNYNLSSVLDIVCAAAPLGRETQTLLENRLNVRVRQAYGLTECSFLTLMPFGSETSKHGSSGILVFDTEAKVLDVNTHELLGSYEKGELCFKSDRNMLEYLNNEKETKQTVDEDGFVHTGDIGYYDEDGYFFIVDRLKELIKFKGFQVAPAELENILVTHKGVKDAAVIGIPDDRAGELPYAFVVKDSEAQISETEIIDYVSGFVSSYKRLTGGLKFVDEIPKNPSGKILRKILKERYAKSEPALR